MDQVLKELADVLEARKLQSGEESYVAGLYQRGLEAILDKVDEEAGETITAAREGDQAAIIHEVADLWFHTLVLLAHKELGPDDVLEELGRRFGVSGLVEKANRE